MALYRIDVGDGTDTNTVVPDAGWRFSKNLNHINEAELKFSGTGEARRSLLKIGSTVYIYKDGALAFKGLIDNTDYFVGGTVVFHASGWEVWMAKEPGAYSGSPWTATASATIFAAIIAESTHLAAGTINAGYSMDYRLTTSQSLWNGMSNLANKTSQDVSIDYTASPVEISILDHTGSATSVAVLNEGKEITNVRKSEGYPRGNSIIVKGKGDGADQITGSDSDATSIAAYGTITKTIVDKSIMTTAEANRLAAAELAMNKDPPQIYDFELTNPDYATLNLGDHITLNALDQDVNNEEVRIVGIEEGETTGGQYISLQTTNPALKTLMRTRNKVMAQLQKNQDDSQTYMQGSGNTNTWGSGINAKTNYPLKIGFFLPASYILDEAGNSNVKELTVSYDIDKYKTQFGTASFDGSDPQVQNDSGNTEPDVENSSGATSPTVNNDSGATSPTVNNDSGSTAPTVSGDSGANWVGSTIGTDSNTGVTCNSGTWTSVASVDTTATGNNIYADFYVKGSSGGPEDCMIKLKNSGEITGTDSRFGIYQDGFRDECFTRIDGTYAGVDGTSDYVTVNVYPFTGAIVLDGYLKVYIADHTHDDGTYAAASHSHDDGTYAAASHTHDDGTYAAASHSHDDGTYNAANHGHPDGTYDINASDLDNISIGDDVGEAGTINASSVNIYLDFYNTGTSNWDNKHSIMATGVTMETDVDITNSGTYPDAAGFWRVRIEPITATADFAQAIVKIKNAVDN